MNGKGEIRSGRMGYEKEDTPGGGGERKRGKKLGQGNGKRGKIRSGRMGMEEEDKGGARGEGVRRKGRWTEGMEKEEGKGRKDGYGRR